MARKLKDSDKQLQCHCGHVEVYPAYVFAHWNETLDFTCPNCKAKWSILRGKAEGQKRKRAKS
jgi:hypothetical protein